MNKLLRFSYKSILKTSLIWKIALKLKIILLCAKIEQIFVHYLLLSLEKLQKSESL